MSIGSGARKEASRPGASRKVSPGPDKRRAAIWATWRDEAMATLPGLLGNHGLWLSVMIFMVARALTLAVRYPKIELAVTADTT